MQAYVLHYRPFGSMQQNILEVTNEGAVMLVTYASLVFNMQDGHHHVTGWGVNLVIALNISANLVVALVSLIRGGYQKIQNRSKAIKPKKQNAPGGSGTSLKYQ